MNITSPNVASDKDTKVSLEFPKKMWLIEYQIVNWEISRFLSLHWGNEHQLTKRCFKQRLEGFFWVSQESEWVVKNG